MDEAWPGNLEIWEMWDQTNPKNKTPTFTVTAMKRREATGRERRRQEARKGTKAV